MIQKFLLVAFALLLAVSISPAYAQHHSGSLAPPVDFDGMRLALITALTPENFTLGDSKNPILSIRLFDSDTNTNVKSVTYRIQIFHGDSLVANEYFFDEDGKLDLEIKPKSECMNQELWKCTKYYGEKHPIAGGYFARGDSIPVIQGPVFDKSGEYTVNVSIVGATNPKTMTTKDFLFETFVHIPHKETFLIKTANAQEYPVSIKSYNSETSNFKHDGLLDAISYDTILIQEYSYQPNSYVEQLIILEKDFSSFKQGYDVDVFVDGNHLDSQYVKFDDSSISENIIKIKIPHDPYIEKNNDSLNIKISSGNLIEFNVLDLKFDNNIVSKVSWDSKSETGKNIPFTFSFFDSGNNPVSDILFAYSISDSSGKEIWSNIGTGESYLGILANNGMSQESIFIPSDGEYRLKLILTGQNSQNFEKFLVSQLDFDISNSVVQEKKSGEIPSWIKNNAGWWSEGTIDEDSFIGGIQFLIKEGIIDIPDTPQTAESKSSEIPQWIKNNAGWWSQGLVSDSDFILGIQFLISTGVLVV
ncbi:MAG: peptidase [Candidatus Nitrosopumilus sp. bin_7KS]